MVLHRDERRPAVPLRDVLGLGELPRVHRRGADVAGLAGAYDVVQRLHRLLDRHRRVPPVDLVEVDVVRLEPAEAGVDLLQDRLAGQTGAVGPGPHPAVDLGGEDDVLAVGVRLQRPAGVLLAGAGGVDVRGVEGVDAGFERRLDRLAGERLVLHPRPARSGVAPAHAAEGDGRDLEAGVPEVEVAHGRGSPSSVEGVPHQPSTVAKGFSAGRLLDDHRDARAVGAVRRRAG